MLDFFITEMERGLDLKESSLSMIPTYISDKSSLVPGKKLIVIDAGGTNLRTCLVTFNKELQPEITDFKKVPMPGVKSEVSAKEFFSVFANQVQDIIDKSDYIGFCFSYAATISPDNDGTPIIFSKEIKAPEVIGKKVGASLLAELKNRGYNVENKKVAVLNDTVATLLAGKAASSKDKQYDGYIGFILGTGTNTAYLEKNENIVKLSNLDPGSQVINVESGSLIAKQGLLDKLFNSTTKDPSQYILEKMISGAYLGPLSNVAMERAVDDGILSNEFGKRFAQVGYVNTTEMSNYLEMPFNEDYKLVQCVKGNNNDSENLWHILKSIIERAAKMTAINLTAAVIKTDFGKNPLHPVCINADGTTFYKTEYLEKYTNYYLEQLLVKKYNRYYETVCIDNSPTIGAAIAALGLK
ncbi:MAG: hexokinase [Spirochaetaceae bacterium]|nr:hexokinase [Spirochaetaceae bacterium]